MSCFINTASGCVFLTCEGEMTLSEMTTAWHQVRGRLTETGWNRVLVDTTALRTRLHLEEYFDLAKIFCRDFPESGRIALVIRWDQARVAKSLEMLVRTVGRYLTVFVSEEKAEAWVLENTPAGQRMEKLTQ